MRLSLIAAPSFLIAGLIIAGLGLSAAARAEDGPVLSLKDHKFQPERLEVPAGVKFKLTVRNQDDTPAEFESSELNREKVVPPGKEIQLFLGPLDPGEYKIFDDFHQDTTRGVLIAK